MKINPIAAALTLISLVGCEEKTSAAKKPLKRNQEKIDSVEAFKKLQNIDKLNGGKSISEFNSLSRETEDKDLLSMIETLVTGDESVAENQSKLTTLLAELISRGSPLVQDAIRILPPGTKSGDIIRAAYFSQKYATTKELREKIGLAQESAFYNSAREGAWQRYTLLTKDGRAKEPISYDDLASLREEGVSQELLISLFKSALQTKSVGYSDLETLLPDLDSGKLGLLIAQLPAEESLSIINKRLAGRSNIDGDERLAITSAASIALGQGPERAIALGNLLPDNANRIYSASIFGSIARSDPKWLVRFIDRSPPGIHKDIAISQIVKQGSAENPRNYIQLISDDAVRDELNKYIERK